MSFSLFDFWKGFTPKNSYADTVDAAIKMLSEGMSGYRSFDEYKNSLIKRIDGREPGILNNPFEVVLPILYLDNPLQSIRLDRIDNLPESAIITKHGLEQYKEMGIEPGEGSFHGARLGRQIDIPIAVKINRDGTFSITDGTHRAVQSVISDNKTILAFVDGGTGPTLKEIFNKVNNPI